MLTPNSELEKYAVGVTVQGVVGNVVHLQTPLTHNCMSGHVAPQPPQLSGSFCSLTQAPLHTVSGHVHVPPVQVSLAEHALPHVPQFDVVESLTQAPLHAIWPLGHVHVPPMQLPPVAHALPQVPQFEVDESLTHAPLQ